MRKFEIAKGFEEKDVVIPVRATSKSAGYDLRSLETYTLKPGERHTFPTGLKACMEDDEVLYIFVRSSMAIKKGVRLSNSVGVIDADYYSNPDNDGHIMVSLFNFSDKDVEILAGDRIAQGIFMKYLATDDDVASGERKGGFGSTNK
jgi:dUTP pyrophosphatase